MTQISPTDRLNGADRANLELDKGDNYYTITVAGLLEPGGFIDPTQSEIGQAIDIESLRQTIDRKIGKIPRLQMRIKHSPKKTIMQPVELDLFHHVRIEETLVSEDSFIDKCAQLSTKRLDPSKPLWEFLLYPIQPLATSGESVPVKSVGWVFRVHHALFDGTLVSQVCMQLFDPLDQPPKATAPPTQRPSKLLSLLVAPIASVRMGANMLRHILRPLPSTALLGPLGSKREAQIGTYSLKNVLATSHKNHAKLNDILLISAAQGARNAYRLMDEIPPARFPISVPILLPGALNKTNQVAAAVIQVPLCDEPLEKQVQNIARDTKKQIALARQAPLPWFSASATGGKTVRRYIENQRMIGLLTTNVRGPDQAISLAGAPVTKVWGLPVMAGNVRLSASATSYNGSLTVAAFYSSELGEAGKAFAKGIHQTMSELSKTSL